MFEAFVLEKTVVALNGALARLAYTGVKKWLRFVAASKF